MNITHSTAVILLAVSVSSYAAGPSVAPDIEPASVAATQAITRTQVRQELQQAIANGEIRHGDLADFQLLVTPSAARSALADKRSTDGAPTEAGVAVAKPANQGDRLAGTASSGR